MNQRKPEATQALRAASKVLVHVQSPPESSLGVALFDGILQHPARLTGLNFIVQPVNGLILTGKKIGIPFRGSWQQANREKKILLQNQCLLC